MNKLNITFCSFPDYAGNAKTLYQYMKKRYKENMNYTWIINKKEMIPILRKKGIKAILINSKEYEQYISKTNVFFTTHANLIFEKDKASNAIYIELWHGVGPKPIGFLDNYLSKSDEEWYNYVSQKIDYFIVPSSMWKIIFSSMLGMDARRIKDIAMPVLDEIIKSPGKSNLSKVLNIDVNQYDKIIMYMPTYKKGLGRKLEATINEHNVLNLYDYEEKELIEYLTKKNYLLIVKRHPSDECNYKVINNENIKELTNEMLSALSLDVNDILNAGDVMITDYSSIGTEFMFLDKPVIYITTDIDEYKINRGIVLEDYDFWAGGVTTNTYKHLIELIDELIGKPYIHKNKNMFFGNLKDGGCKNICDMVFNNYLLNKDIKQYFSNILNLETKTKIQNETINNLEAQVKSQTETINKLNESKIELEQIKKSRSWQVLEKYRKIRYKNNFKK